MKSDLILKYLSLISKVLKKFKLPLLFFFILFIFPFCSTTEEEKIEIHKMPVFDLSGSDSLWVEETLAQLTLREKCAQMIMPHVDGVLYEENSPEYKRLQYLVNDLKVGGFIFFKGKIKEQAELTNKLQEMSKIPLLIAADYERGLGMRLEDAVEFPYNMAIGAAGDYDLTYLMGKATAIEGRAIGVHQNYAPLLDINHEYKNPIINIRAYSENPYLVARHSSAFLRGMHAGEMIATAKHFPGHGATDLDSHNELPLIEKDLDELEKSDLVPFENSIKEGIKSVMVGHLEVPALEDQKGVPATLSKNIINNLLINKLKFNGLIVTDAMNMRAVTKNYSNKEAAKLAVEAGNDVILFPPDEKDAVEGIYESVLNGEISEGRIDFSIRKILSAKVWLGLDKRRLIDVKEIDKKIKKSHFRIAKDIAERSITLVKDEKNMIPLDPAKYRSTAIITVSDSRTRLPKPYHFEKISKNIFRGADYLIVNRRSKKRDYDAAFREAKRSALIILSTYVNVRSSQGTISLDSNHVEFIKNILDLKKPTLILSFGNPYILTEFKNAETYIAAYGAANVSQQAMLDAVLGRIEIRGKLPISIPETDFELGFGLNRFSKGLYFPDMQADSNYNFVKVDSLMKAAVDESVFPGGVLVIGKKDRVIYNRAFGKFSYDKKAKKMTKDAIFDLASLTKVLATTSAAMLLYDEGKLDLDARVSKYLPEFAANGKEKVKIKNLLLHNSGLPAFKTFYKDYSTGEEVIDDIMNSKLEFMPDSNYLYSDLGMITLQKVLEKITDKPLDEYIKENLFEPLNLKNTMFNPPAKLKERIAPTEMDNYWRKKLMRGEVHDETAYLLGGVSGHAGLFSDAHDVAVLMNLFLNKGRYGNKQFIKQKTVDEWTSRQSKMGDRGYGWSIKSTKGSSAGNKFSANSFGHTGFTGTSVWADKDNELFVVLLTNRVNPTRDNRKIIDFRPVLHNAIYDATSYF